MIRMQAEQTVTLNLYLKIKLNNLKLKKMNTLNFLKINTAQVII
mgnify:CR=1 FL=1